MDGPENIPQWPDIKSSSVFNALDDAEKERTRAAYFRQIIEPTLEPGQVASARSQWDELTGPVGPTSITDYGASALSGAASGLGMIFQGGGELLARGVNAVAGTSLRAINPLQGAIDYLQESQTPGAKRAQAQSQISGSLFDPSTYDFGTNPNASGLALQGLNAIGQFAPNLAIAIATSGASIPAQLGIGATVGGLQALGGGAEEERTKFMAMGDDELAASSQLYRDLVANGTKPEVAKRAVAEAAALGGGIGNAIPSAAEGAFENFLIGAITRGRFRFPSVFGAGAGVAGKVATGLVGGAMLGGSEEAVEQIGQNLGVNAAIGGNRQLTADTLQQFVMGAIAEGAAGGGGAYVARNIAQERQAPAIPGASSSFGGVPPGPSPADQFSRQAEATATAIQSQPTVEAAAGAAQDTIGGVPLDVLIARAEKSLGVIGQTTARIGLINAASKSEGVGPIGTALRDTLGPPQPETGITTPLPVRLFGQPIEEVGDAELDQAIQNHPMSAFRVAAEQEKARRAANVDRGTSTGDSNAPGIIGPTAQNIPQAQPEQGGAGQRDVAVGIPAAAGVTGGTAGPTTAIQPAAPQDAPIPQAVAPVTTLLGYPIAEFTTPQLQNILPLLKPEARPGLMAEIARRAPPPAPPVKPATAVAPPPTTEGTRIYLAVPFTSRNFAKTHGAKWDSEEKLWFDEKRKDGQINISLRHFIPQRDAVVRDKNYARAAALNATTETGREHHAIPHPDPMLAGGYTVVEKGAPARTAAPPPPPAPKPLTGTVLQNRDRSSAASRAWIKSASANLSYLGTGPSTNFQSGAFVGFEDQPTIPANRFGREGRILAAGGRIIPFRYAVVDIRDTLRSHAADGTPNEGYETGVPGKVRIVAGNGRGEAIAEAFRTGRAARYVEDFRADAEGHGIAPSEIDAVEQPALIRVIAASEITPDIGDLSNISQAADLSPAEKATNDARRLDMSGLEFSEDGQITRNAVKQFVAALPDTERSGLIDHAGEPTRQAYDRLTNAVFLQAYGDAELVSLQSQATDPEARTVMTALTRAAPVMMKLEGAESLDIRSVVIEAAKAAVNAKRQGASLVRFAQQVDLTMHPESSLVLKFFADNIRSAARIADGLTRAATTAVEEAAKPATDMFGAVPRASRADILRRLSETDIQENLGERAGVKTPGQDVERGGTGQPGPADNRPAEEGGPAETGLRQPTPEYEAAGVAPPGAAEAISRHGLPENTAWDRGRGPISDKWAASASGVQSNYHATADAAAKELREFLDAAGHARAADEAVNRAQNSAADKLRRGENPTFPEWKAAFPQLRQGHTYLRQPDIAPFLIEHFGFRRNDIRSNLGEAAGTLTSDTGAQYPIVYFNKLERVLSQAPPAFDLAGQTPEELRAAARARRAEAATKSAAERAAAEAAASALEREAIRQAAAKDGPLELTPTSAVDKATQKALDEKDALDQLSGQGGLFQTRARYEVVPRLSVLHNLNAENLKFADRLGGLPVPSLGIVREGMGISGMGDITLIGRRELADPAAQPVHDADTYSPTFPRPEYDKARYATAERLFNELKPFGDKFDDGNSQHVTVDNSVTNPDPQKIIATWVSGPAPQAMFLSGKGVDVEPVMMDKSVTFNWVRFGNVERMRALLKEITGDPTPANDVAHRATVDLIEEMRAAIRRDPDYQRYRKLAGAAQAMAGKAHIFGASGQWINAADAADKMPGAILYRLQDSIDGLGKQEVDRSATRERLAEALKGQEAEFKTWVDDKVMAMFGRPFLRLRGRKEPYNLANIVEAMSGRVRATEETMTFGPGKARAAAASRFQDIEQMRRAASQIGDESEIKAARDHAAKLLEDWRNSVIDYYGDPVEGRNAFGRTWDALDASMKALARWARGAKTEANMKRALATEGFRTGEMSDYHFEDGVAAGQAWMKAPVPYFEAKPQRAVALNEFAGAVIPEKTDAATRTILDKHGIPYRTYAEGQQQRATDEFRAELAGRGENVLFQAQAPYEAGGGVPALTPAGEYNLPDAQTGPDQVQAPRGKAPGGQPPASGQGDLFTAAALPGFQKGPQPPIVVSAVQRGLMRIGYDRLDTPEKAAQAFSALRKSPREHFQIIVTDAQDRPLAAWHLFSGTLTTSSVYPREVMTAIYMTPGAGKVWFSHNHPSGVADPSHADQMLTEGLVRAGLGRDIGVELAGHIIIAARRARMFSAADPLGYVFDIPAASRKVAIPILERTITRQSFADRAPLNNPDRVRNYLSDEKNRPREPGLLLMDAQNRPLGFWPISVADMGALRTSDVNTGAGRVIQMVGRLNPGAAIAYVPGVDDFTTQRAVANIGSLLNGIDVRMIDGFVVEPGPQGKVTSYAERGFDLAAPTFYSRGDTGATGISVSDLETAIGEALDQLDTGYTLHANIEEARAATGAQHPADAKAFFDNGRMHFVAANLDSAQDAEEQLWHETLHAGIARLYGQRGRAYEQALTTIAGRNPNLRTEARQWREDFGEDARRTAVDSGMTDDQARRHVTLTSYEEALARLSGRNAKISGLSQFLAAVQRFLRAVGLTRLADAMEAATDAEALNLVLRAREAVTTGRGVAGPVSSATLETKFSRTTPQATAQFKALLDTLGRDDVNAILGDWNDSELSEDGSRIVQYSGRDREFSTGKEGGKHTIPKADFLSWLASDAPFAEIKDPEWRAQIEAARRAAFGEQRGALRIDQTQTPEFKNFFGDWEALRAQGKLDSMMPVSIQIPAGWERLPKTELRQRVADALDAAVRDRAEIVHPELGAIKIGRRGVNKTISASPDPAKLLIANDLANVIPATVVMATQPGNAPNILQRTTLAARVQIGRTELVALAAVNQQEDGRWYYNTVVVEDPQIQTPTEAGAGTPGHVRGATAETESNPLLTEVANFIRRSLRRVNPALVSKVVDASDKPLAVYNGTTAVFTAFSLNKLGEKTGAADAREGFFFSENPDAAEQFTWADGEKSGSIMPVYLAIKNPFVSDHVLNGATGTIAGKIIAQAKASGHDGVIFTQSDMLGHKGKTYVAFRPEQIKSAIGNTGTFSPTNPDIRYSRGPVAAVQPALNSARQVIDDIITSDRVLNRVISKVNTPFHLAETHPEFKPVYTEAQNYTADTSRYANEAADQAPNLLVRIESFGDFNRTLPTDADLSAIERALHIGTLWGGPSPLQGRLWRDAELKAGRIKEGGLPVFTPLNDAQIKLYRQHLAAVSTGLEEHSKSLIWKIADTAGLEVDHEMPIADVAQNARDAADGAIETLNARLQYLSDQDRIDGHVQGMDAARASEYRRKQEDEAARVADKIDGLEKLKASVSDIEQKTADLIAHGYTPLMRFGAYAVNVVSFDENGAETEEFFGRYDTQQEANRAKRDLAREFKDQNVRITSSVLPQEAHKLFQGLNLDALSIFAEYMTDDEGRPISENPAIQAYLRLATTERSALNRMIHRKGTPGFSKDVSRGLAQFTVSMAQATSRNYHSASMLSLANDIRAGDLKDYAARYVRYLQDPQEEAQALRGFLAQYYILGSIAFGAVNLTQPILMTVPALSAHTSYANAMREIVRAAGNMVTGRKTLSAEERHAYNRAAKAGKVSPQEIHQLRADTKATMFGASPMWQKIDSLLASRGMKLPGRLLMRKLSFVWGSIYALTEQVNRGTTFLAAYRIAKQNKERDPYGFAVNMVDATQGVYARSNRPEISRGPIGAPLLVFKQFSIAYIELAKRLYDTDKKAFAVLMLTLIALAGADGLPFAEDVEDLIDVLGQWMGYATNSKKELRKLATNLLGKEMGDVLLHGMSAIPGMPIDVSQRMGMHNLIPGTGLLKTSEADKTRDIQDILGPAASLAKNIGQAVEGIATGHPGQVKLLAPLAIQNILKGIEMAQTDVYTDQRGRKILSVDAVDSIFKMIGFQPAAVAAETRIVGQNQQDIALQKIIESSIADNWAHGLTDPDPDLVRRSREQLAEWNSKNPELIIRLNQGQILRRVREIRSTREQRFIRSAPPEIRGSVRQDFPQ